MAPATPDPAVANDLLMAVAGDPDNTDTARRFDEYMYPLVLNHVRKRHQFLAADAGRVLGTPVRVPATAPAEREAAIHDTVVVTLRRVRSGAQRFDPARGDAIDWTLRAAAFAWWDVVRGQADATAKAGQPTDESDLSAALDSCPAAPPQERAEDLMELNQALAQLPNQERDALLLCLHQGYTYAEAAEILLGDRNQVRKIDRLIQKAKATVRELLSSRRLAGR
ncbi:MAG TPA: sigma-70 family RNA polymerase sigma factor [Acidimicrobiales bacterium]|nr:sigma-70 family RNA polymerase sigma factor [Acidimicrobiales bacterium]